MFLLDTNVVSELRKIGDGKADTNVAAWTGRETANDFYISTITLMEIEIGLQRLQRRDPAQVVNLRAWMDDQILIGFSNRILPVDAAVALRCARLHVPNSAPYQDALIAATALVHGMTVVTRNVKDFASTGVRVLNPWDPQN